MKRIIKAVCSLIISFLVLTHSFPVYALDFDAEQTFDSVFVVLSKLDLAKVKPIKP